MLRLILVRHGETDLNSEERLQGGQSDVPLNEKGKEQAICLGLALKEERIAAIYSSSLQRAMATAEAIASHHNLEVQAEPDLRKLELGLLEGVEAVSVRDKLLDFRRQWGQGEFSVPFQGGESLAQMHQRAWGVMQRIMQRHKEGSVVIVGHSFVLQSVIPSVLGASLSTFLRFRVGVASINILHIDGSRGSLVRLNDTCHLNIIK
jgi:probable phosphoglycerate mutase